MTICLKGENNQKAVMNMAAFYFACLSKNDSKIKTPVLDTSPEMDYN